MLLQSHFTQLDISCFILITLHVKNPQAINSVILLPIPTAPKNLHSEVSSIFNYDILSG